MSRKASRTLINAHHQLQKQRHQAFIRGDQETEANIAAELAGLGGLGHYQLASLQGQSIDRGGDTSKVLLAWLPVMELRKSRPLRMLEIGALSTSNACSTSGIFDIVHIDLNSQEPGIQQQDFMQRPLPKDKGDRFDILSLSLVLNFVPDAAARGQMLLRTLSFLREEGDGPSVDGALFPCLFVVLPRSCIENSRYFTDVRFTELMALLGYSKIQSKLTQKLAYSLWRRATALPTSHPSFSKQEINPGRTRNNFVMTLLGKKS